MVRHGTLKQYFYKMAIVINYLFSVGKIENKSITMAHMILDIDETIKLNKKND